MPTITLGYGAPKEVTQQTYDAICAIIENEKVCTDCHKQYSPDNPEVSANLCLTCALNRFSYSPDKTYKGNCNKGKEGLRYIRTEKPGDYRYYLFTDKYGKVYCTSPDYSQKNPELIEDVAITLRFYGFPTPLPQRIIFPDGGDSSLSQWYICTGNPATDSAVIVRAYANWYDSKGAYTEKRYMYLIEKNGSCRLIEKNKTPFVQLWKKARANAEAVYKKTDSRGNVRYAKTQEEVDKGQFHLSLGDHLIDALALSYYNAEGGK